MRTVTIDGNEYKYTVGRDTCAIRFPRTKKTDKPLKTAITLRRLTDICWHDIEEAQIGHYCMSLVEPHHIVEWIHKIFDTKTLQPKGEFQNEIR